MAQRQRRELGAERQAATTAVNTEIDRLSIGATLTIGAIVGMAPQLEEEVERAEATANLREVVTEEEVAEGVDDQMPGRVLSVDAIAKEDSSREHAHPRSQGNKVACRMAATIR